MGQMETGNSKPPGLGMVSYYRLSQEHIHDRRAEAGQSPDKGRTNTGHRTGVEQPSNKIRTEIEQNRPCCNINCIVIAALSCPGADFSLKIDPASSL
jgi:hypothetical protein